MVDLCGTDQKRVKFADQGLESIKHAQKKAFKVANELGEMAENWTGLDLVKENKRLQEENEKLREDGEHWEALARNYQSWILKETRKFNAASATINESNGLTGAGEPMNGINAEMSTMIDDPPAPSSPAATPVVVEDGEDDDEDGEDDDDDVSDSASACTRFTATTRTFHPARVNKRVQGDFSAWLSLADKGETKTMVADLVQWLTARKCNPFSSLEQAHAFRTKYHTSDGTKSYYNNEQVLNEYFSKHYGKGTTAMAKHKGTLTTIKNSLIKRMGRARAQPESYLSKAALLNAH